jgi:hypothetical protein
MSETENKPKMDLTPIIIFIGIIILVVIGCYIGMMMTQQRVDACNNAIIESKNEECYWSQVTLANRLAACGIEETSVIGGGCGRLVYYNDEDALLLICNYTDCTANRVNWNTKYAFEEGKAYQVIESVIWCPMYETFKKGVNNDSN